ncbi:hypothetical protein Bca101_081723 [Brassica carinata]
MEYSEGTKNFCAFSESSKVLYLSRWKLLVGWPVMELSCVLISGFSATVVSFLTTDQMTIKLNSEYGCGIWRVDVGMFGGVLDSRPEVLVIRGDKARVKRSNCDRDP